jgi:UDP-GlcNAc:undecaprenyl-phosphate/decaprenyl-phosphate GlcNAc-1-phosphate transferase
MLAGRGVPKARLSHWKAICESRLGHRGVCYTGPRMSLPGSFDALLGNGAAAWGFLTALAIVLALTPIVVRLAPRIGALDIPTDRPRVHSRPVPRVGGIAIVTGILIPAAIFVHPDGPFLGILIGTLCVALLGLVDDLRGMRPIVKLAGVSAIALIPVVGYGVTIAHVTLPLIGTYDLGGAQYPLTILWIAAFANLVNLVDGMDALAAGLVAIAAFTLALLGASFERADGAAMAAIVCGATLGFLRHNYHPARIFMGDTGALALGFLIATIAVEGVAKTAATIALAGPMLLMAVPILDTSFVVLKRLKYRRPPWEPDHNHFYHRFLRIGFSQRRTAAYLHLWAGLLAAFAILVRFVPPRPGGEWDLGNSLIVTAVGLVVVAASLWIVYTLEILKARHLQLLGFKRLGEPPESEHEEAVEQVITAEPHLH